MEAVSYQTESLVVPPVAIAPLQQMAKALEKGSPRNYARVIGIRNGFACVTDGFGLLQWRLPALDGLDGSVNPNMTESNVKFPNWSGVLDTVAKPLPVRGADTLALIRAFGKEPRGACIRLVFVETGDAAFPTLQASPVVLSFNPTVAARFLKVLPKDATVVRAEIHGEQLQMEFDSGHTFVLMAVTADKR